MNKQELSIRIKTRELARIAPSLTALSQMEGRVYVHLETPKQAAHFLRLAEQEGFRFNDGEKPTARDAATVIALNPDHTINYVDTVGRIAYGSDVKTVGDKLIIRIAYSVGFDEIYSVTV